MGQHISPRVTGVATQVSPTRSSRQALLEKHPPARTATQTGGGSRFHVPFQLIQAESMPGLELLDSNRHAAGTLGVTTHACIRKPTACQSLHQRHRWPCEPPEVAAGSLGKHMIDSRGKARPRTCFASRNGRCKTL